MSTDAAKTVPAPYSPDEQAFEAELKEYFGGKWGRRPTPRDARGAARGLARGVHRSRGRAVSFCIQLVHCTGGSKTILGETLGEVRNSVRAHCGMYPRSYLASTLPYEVTPGRSGCLDVSIPLAWREALSPKLIRKYLDENDDDRSVTP